MSNVLYVLKKVSMISKLALFLLLISCSSASFAEYKPPISMGLSKETYVVNEDASVIQTSESYVKIETQSGVDNGGKRSFSYNSKHEDVQILEAYTLQPNGKKLKVEKDAIRTTGDTFSFGAPMFSETKHKVIVYPMVKIGSLLYLKMKSVQRIPTFKGHYFFSQYFSPHYHYQGERFRFVVSDKIPVQFHSKGVEGGLVKEVNHKKYYEFTFHQHLALPPEGSEVDSDDYSPYLIASSFKDQVELGKAYEKGAADKVKVTPEIKNLADSLTLDIPDTKGQVEVLYNWVSKNIRYVAIYLGHGGVVPHSAETILKNQYGDCKDHTVILAALLKAKGIESSPALINLGENYSLPKLAVLTPHNHVINYIPSLNIYLDSTAQFAPYGTLPFEDMDKPVILTSLGKIGHTPSPKTHENIVTSNVNIRINEDGSMLGNAIGTVTGFYNSSYRALASENQGKDDIEKVSSRLLEYGETGVGKIVETNPSDLMTPFIENTTFNLDPKSNFPGPGAMTIPVGVVISSSSSLIHKKPNNSLKFPSICYSKALVENYTLKFPNNTKVTRIPNNVEFNNGPIKYQATYWQNGNEVKVRRVFKSNHKSSLCDINFNNVRKETFKVLQRDLRSQVFYE